MTISNMTLQRRIAGTAALSITLAFAACTGGTEDEDGGDTSTDDATTAMTTMDGDTTAGDTAVDTTVGGMDTSSGGATEDSSGSSSGSESSTGEVACVEDVIELPGDSFFPEGIHAHSDGTLYVGSIGTGEIVTITPCDPGGQHDVTVFNDGADLTATLGLLVDETNDMLWACNSDLTGVMPGQVVGLNLADGAIAFTHNFDAGACNDMTMDADGNLYATETFGSRIMVVPSDELLSDNDAEEWSNDTLYDVTPGEFGLNGIAFDGVDTIYSVNYDSGEMYTTLIQGNGNAANPSLVDLGGALLGPDGMKAEDATNFLVVEQLAASLIRVTVDAGSGTIEVIDDTLDVPTTAVTVGADVWVVESQLDHLLDDDGADPPELPFEIVRISR